MLPHHSFFSSFPPTLPQVVYGDTDSVFVNIRGASHEDAVRIGREIEATITKHFPYPVKLKYEKVIG